MYGKYSTRVQGRPHPEYCIFCTSQVNSVLTDLLFCIGGLAVAVAVAMNSKHDALFLPQNTRWSTLKLHNSESALHNDKPMSHNNKCLTKSFIA